MKKASESLVSAAKQQAANAEDDGEVSVNRAIVGGIAQEIEATEAILLKERELEEAKKQLLKIRKAKYGRAVSPP